MGVATNFINKEVIESTVVITEDGCWEWHACKSSVTTGYASMSLNGKSRSLHRISFEVYHRPLVQGECVLHKCDNRLCINPSHLFAGSKGDNNRDRAEKGRSSQGESCHLSKLTEELAREIHDAVGTYRGLGRKYGLNKGTIKQIKTEVTWKHLWK